PVISFNDVETPGACPQEKTIVRTWTATDACGNSSSCDQTIQVVDTTPPVIACPPNVTVDCLDSTDPSNTGSATCSDNCGAATTTFVDEVSQPDPDCPNKTITRTWTCTDECDNSASCIQIIMVVDQTPPMITCAADKEIICPEEPVFDDPIVTDDCSAVTVTFEDQHIENGTSQVWIRTWTAFDACGNGPAMCSQTITQICPSDEFCTLTQGFYSSPNGKWNGESAVDLIARLLTEGGNLVVGVLGTRSVTFGAEDALCINLKLPGGTTPMTLPDFGDQVFDDATCQTPSPLPLYDGDRWMNVFLGQTVTLGLNLRLDSDLGGWELEPEFCTLPALPGPDGILGTEDDEIDFGGTVQKYTIPQSVFDYFTLMGILTPTVDDLFALANKALAGMNISPTTVNEVNFAVNSINVGFDKCAWVLPSCPAGVSATTVLNLSLVGAQSALSSAANEPELAGSNLPTEFELQQNYPNPFNPTTRINVAVPKATNWTLRIYNVSGKLVRSYDGNTGGPAFVDVEWNGKDMRGQPVSTGVYFYRVTAGEFRAMKKMVLIK
ncbi:MAG: T9SS type A sorting domain-containing protein, partial [Candidatus Krumholzibacteria bacterium]|nr:T9SS type A sorting domain-containing protein [Candidatus Krumholzibacteria bacterium]